MEEEMKKLQKRYQKKKKQIHARFMEEREVVREIKNHDKWKMG